MPARRAGGSADARWASRRDGAPLSYATPRQMDFLAWLAEMAFVVPVTARSRDALDRVRIRYDAAICAHGGLILDADGTPDAAWSRAYRA